MLCGGGDRLVGGRSGSFMGRLERQDMIHDY